MKTFSRLGFMRNRALIVATLGLHAFVALLAPYLKLLSTDAQDSAALLQKPSFDQGDNGFSEFHPDDQPVRERNPRLNAGAEIFFEKRQGRLRVGTVKMDMLKTGHGVLLGFLRG